MTALVEAWQAALGAEHRAAFAYGLVGAQLHGTADGALVIACSDAHERLRNATEVAMTAAGLTPAAPAADYPGLYAPASPPPWTRARSRSVALGVERDCAAAWRFLYSVAAATAGVQATDLRGRAQSGLTASAVRATRWARLVQPAAATVAFPGVS